MRTVSLDEFSISDVPAGSRERLLLAALPGLIVPVSTAGEELGVIITPFGGAVATICSPFSGTVWAGRSMPPVRVFPAGDAWSPRAVRDTLMAGEPSVHINAESDGLMINTHCVRPRDERIIVERLRVVLDGASIRT